VLKAHLSVSGRMMAHGAGDTIWAENSMCRVFRPTEKPSSLHPMETSTGFPFKLLKSQNQTN